MKSSRLSLAFAGTPVLASDLLDFLITDNLHDVGLVLTQPDRRSGRGRKTIHNPIKQCAEKYNIQLLQPQTAAEIDIQKLSDFDLLVVVAYGMILPAQVLNAPASGCINVHFSLLPRWRGASPIQHAILAGDKETGVSIMQMDEGLDTGPVYLNQSCKIEENETSGSLHNKLVTTAKILLTEFLDGFSTSNIPLQPQDDALTSYAPKITKQDALIDWHRSNKEIDRKIRAFNPVPIAYSIIEGCPLRIWEADLIDEQYDARPGKVIRCDKQGIAVMSGNGAINIRKLQVAGKKPMTVAEFLNGRPDFPSKRLCFES